MEFIITDGFKTCSVELTKAEPHQPENYQKRARSTYNSRCTLGKDYLKHRTEERRSDAIFEFPGPKPSGLSLFMQTGNIHEATRKHPRKQTESSSPETPPSSQCSHRLSTS